MPKLHPDLLAEAQKLVNKNPADIVAVYVVISARCVFASPSHEAILGYTESEMIGQTWKTFVAREDHAHATIAGADAMLLGRSIEFGFNGFTKSRELVPLRGSAWIRTNPGTLNAFLFFQAHLRDQDS